MNKIALSLVAAALVLIPRATFAQDFRFAHDFHSQPAILVDDDKVQCPSAAYTTIQAAVDAASPGARIHVCPGTYPEQITITKSLTIDADNGVLIVPAMMTGNITSLVSGDPLAVAISVQNAEDVDIDGLIVDGSNNGLTACAPSLIGILYQNASGRVAHNTVRNFILTGSNIGCQSGNAIEVETATDGSSRVEISENSVNNYQKNGVTANETGTEIDLEGNTVTGVGPTTGAAQNGVQIGYGAGGRVRNNTITDNVYSPCTASTCDTNAAGILIYNSDGIDIENNSVGTNQVGIYVGGNQSRIAGNSVFNSIVLIGVALVGDQNEVTSNTITHSDQIGVYIQGNNNQVHANKITDAQVGIYKVTGQTGNSLTGNTFFSTLTTIQDPAPLPKIGVSPSH
jgi:nitrous oxidase accessory protein NosD